MAHMYLLLSVSEVYKKVFIILKNGLLDKIKQPNKKFTEP